MLVTFWMKKNLGHDRNYSLKNDAGGDKFLWPVLVSGVYAEISCLLLSLLLSLSVWTEFNYSHRRELLGSGPILQRNEAGQMS